MCYATKIIKKRFGATFFSRCRPAKNMGEVVGSVKVSLDLTKNASAEPSVSTGASAFCIPRYFENKY